LGPKENSVIWQNMEKCKGGKAVSNHVFSDLRRWNFLPTTCCYIATLFSLSIAKGHWDVVTLT
jgi:hypothetical protein